MINFQSISVGAIALATFVASGTLFASEDAKMATHDGTVVSITSTKLVMATKDGKEHSHVLAKDSKVTLDGKDCKPADLKAGTKIRVTTNSTDTKAATHIEAIEANKLFANTHDGKVVTANAAKLVMTDMNGKEHSHSLTSDTKITCDGKVCKAADLKAGLKIRVTTKKSDEAAATCIEAIDKNGDFV